MILSDKIKKIKRHRNLIIETRKLRQSVFLQLKEMENSDGNPMHNVEYLKKVLKI
jgi:hypothetical protein